jgi:hypothetical protein
MAHCDREDFDFHYTYELEAGVLKKLNVVDEVVDSWLLEDAPEEELLAALDEVRPAGDYSDEITADEIRTILRSQLR